jgi:dipeptidyl aminopeptidase/acylaminoacyl peptidase
MSTPQRYGMLPEDVYLLEGVADPHIAPDGTQVAYQATWIDREKNGYRGAIWSAALDGSTPPRRLTWGEKDSSPRWSPDGRWLAFTSSRGDDKSPQQLYVLPAAGGEARRLTDGKESVSELEWSPDSTRIAYTMRVRDQAYDEEDESRRAPRRIRRLLYKLDGVGWTTDRRSHIFVVSIDGGDPRQLTEGDCENSQPAWSPDGAKIAFGSLRGERWDLEFLSRIYLIGADGGEPTVVTGTEGSCSGPSFSPDGSMIAYYYELSDGTGPHNGQVGVVGADGSDPRLLTTGLDLNCTPSPNPPRLSWQAGRIVFSAEDRGNRHVYAVPADGSAGPALVAGGERLITHQDVRDGHLAFVSSRAAGLPQLHAAGFDGPEVPLTSIGADFQAGRELAAPERFTSVSADGSEVDAWLVRPAGFSADGSFPVLLSIHGGPYTQYGTGFFDEYQVYAAAGYAVLFANPRGSSGRSEEWGRAIRGPINGAGPGWGTLDFQDLMGVVDNALQRYPFLDADRMGVLGGSYGGFMTAWTITHTDRFKAALAERGVYSMTSLFGSSDVFWLFARDFGGPMWEHRDAWESMSPAIYAERIRTPLLIMHSEGDLRAPIEQGEHMFNLLRLLGKEVELLRFPAESHGLSRGGSPVHRVQRFEAILEWFGRYLPATGAPAAAHHESADGQRRDEVGGDGLVGAGEGHQHDHQGEDA